MMILRFLFKTVLLWGVGRVAGRALPFLGRALRMVFR
jgi:hypothetical protein